MILYIEILQTPPKKLLELIKEFSQVAGDKINIQKSDTALNINKLSKKYRKQSHLQ